MAIKDKTQCRQKQDGGFHQQAGDRLDLNLFARIAVKGETEGQKQTIDRQIAIGQQGIAHSRCGTAHGHGLQTAESFPQQQKTETNIDHWRDVVAQAGLYHMVAVDRQNIDKPVAADQQTTEGQFLQITPITKNDSNFVPAPLGADNQA